MNCLYNCFFVIIGVTIPLLHIFFKAEKPAAIHGERFRYHQPFSIRAGVSTEWIRPGLRQRSGKKHLMLLDRMEDFQGA